MSIQLITPINCLDEGGGVDFVQILDINPLLKV